MQDELLWLNGMYTLDALRVVISNAFPSKGSKTQEYRDRPITTEIKEKNRVLTEEEKLQQVKMLWNTFSVMQGNFERTHGDKQNA